MNMNIKKILSFVLSIALVAGLVYVGNLKDSPAIILAENMADTHEEDSHGTYILAATGSDASGDQDTATGSEATGITITYRINDADASKGTLTTPQGATGQITGATITPNPGYYFVKWTNDVDTTKEFTDATLTVEQVESVAKVNGTYRNVVFTANFATDTQVDIEYRVINGPGCSVTNTRNIFWTRTGSPAGSTAVSAAGYIFNVWTNNQNDTTFNTSTISQSQVEQIAKNADGTYKTGVIFTANFKVDPTRVILNYKNGDSSMGTISGTTDTVFTQSGTINGSTATPLKGYRFVSWTYGTGATVATTSNALTKETIDATAKSTGSYVATTYTANFEVDPAGVDMALTLSAGNTTQGHIEVDGQSATSATIRSTAAELSQSIVAVPSTGYIFDKWTYSRNGGTQTDLSRNATLTTADLDATKINGIYTDVTLTANFVQGTDAAISYAVSTAGGGSVSPTTETINAGGTHPQGSTATPDMGYAFSHWTDAAGNTISTVATLSGDIVANAAKNSTTGQYVASTYTAHFVEDTGSIAYLYYTSSDATMGSVTNPQDRVGVTSGGTIAGATANAATGYKFVNWTAGTTVVSSSPILTQTDIDRIAKASGQYATTTFTANFTAQVSVTWTFVTENIAKGTVAGGEKFELSLEEDQAVTAVGAAAQAATGYVFDGWYDSTGTRVSTQTSFVPARVNGKNVSGTYTARFTADPTYKPVLQLTKTTDAKYAKVGDEITYTLSLTNTGNLAATQTVLIDIPGTGLEYVSSTPAATYIDGMYVWGYDVGMNSYETINAGETKTYTMTVRVTEAAGDNISIGSAIAGDTNADSDAIVREANASSLQVHKLGAVAYTATWEQVTATPTSEYRDGVSGFVWGNVVEYDVKITNNSNLALTMDVSDAFTQTGAFGEVSVVRVTGATDGGGQGATRNITIAAGATATIRFSAKVIANIDNYATPGNANAGFENVASISNLKATATLADGTSVVYTADGSGGTIAWVADTNPLAESSVSGKISTRTMDMMATYKFVINWADTVPTYRPASVQVQLKRVDTGEVIEQRTLTAEDRTTSDEWTTTFATVKAYEMAEGLATSFAVGAAISYEAEVLSTIPDGYTASAVSSVGTTFTITYSRPWTPREISSSGVPTSSSGSSGSSSSSSSSSGTGTAASTPATTGSGANAGAYSSRLFTMGTDGSWRVGNTTTGQTSLAGIAAESTNSVRFVLNDGTFISNSWAQISKTENGTTTNSWYHFDGEGRVDAGWYIDSAGDWFYLSDTADDSLGRMNVGWHYESGDGRWYYLDSNGYMLKGWQQIDGAWYYFATGTPYETWQYNILTRRWVYKNIPDDRPLGSMYVNEVTPSGYLVDANGVMYDRQ